MAPELPDNLGINMREMLALRCLEVLLGPGNGITKDGCSSLPSIVGFDMSKSCEDVLEHIVQEVVFYLIFYHFKLVMFLKDMVFEST